MTPFTAPLAFIGTGLLFAFFAGLAAIVLLSYIGARR
jgi:hypothetical protein